MGLLVPTPKASSIFFANCAFELQKYPPAQLPVIDVALNPAQYFPGGQVLQEELDF